MTLDFAINFLFWTEQLETGARNLSFDRNFCHKCAPMMTQSNCICIVLHNFLIVDYNNTCEKKIKQYLQNINFFSAIWNGSDPDLWSKRIPVNLIRLSWFFPIPLVFPQNTDHLDNFGFRIDISLDFFFLEFFWLFVN